MGGIEGAEDGAKMDALTRVSSEAERAGNRAADWGSQTTWGSKVKSSWKKTTSTLKRPPRVKVGEPPEWWGVSQGESACRTGLEFKLLPEPTVVQKQGAYSRCTAKVARGGKFMNLGKTVRTGKKWRSIIPSFS